MYSNRKIRGNYENIQIYYEITFLLYQSINRVIESCLKMTNNRIVVKVVEFCLYIADRYS